MRVRSGRRRCGESTLAPADGMAPPCAQLLRKIDLPERMAADAALMESIDEGNLEEAASWVYETMFGIDSRRTEARDLVEDGRREVQDSLRCNSPSPSPFFSLSLPR